MISSPIHIRSAQSSEIRTLPIPTTLEGLKRQAVQLRKQSGCKHMAALEMVARSMGFRTYAAAKRHFDQIGGAS